MKYKSMKLARAFYFGMLTVMLLTVLVPVVAMASPANNGGNYTPLNLLTGVVMAAGFVGTIKKLNLDSGMYKEKGCIDKGPICFLEEQYAKDAGEESPYAGLSHVEIIMKRKELWAAGKEVPMTAFEKQLAANDIKAYGQHADILEKFFSTAGNVTLFPAYVANELMIGLLMVANVRQYVISQTSINSMTYDKITLTFPETKRQLKKTSEGADLPKTLITVGTEKVALPKFGRMLEASYESLRYARLNVLAKVFQLMGAQVSIDEMDEFIYTCHNGDGNSNGISSDRIVSSAVSAKTDIQDVINWSMAATQPYKLDYFFSKKALLAEYFAALSTMQNPMVQFGFMGISLPKSVEWDRDVMTADRFIGIDSKWAMELIDDGPMLMESDRLINKQLQQTAFSKRTGFAIFDKNAIWEYDQTHA